MYRDGESRLSDLVSLPYHCLTLVTGKDYVSPLGDPIRRASIQPWVFSHSTCPKLYIDGSSEQFALCYLSKLLYLYKVSSAFASQDVSTSLRHQSASVAYRSASPRDSSPPPLIYIETSSGSSIISLAPIATWVLLVPS